MESEYRLVQESDFKLGYQTALTNFFLGITSVMIFSQAQGDFSYPPMYHSSLSLVL